MRPPRFACDAGATVIEEPTPGPAAARNAGLRAAVGDIIAHVDADTVPSSRWLAAIVAPFADPTVVLVAGRNVSYPPQTAAERYIAASGLIESERAVTRPHLPFAPSMNMAVRRDAALVIGGWSEDLATGEDVDFSFRLCQDAGCAIRTHPRRSCCTGTVDRRGLRRQAWTYGEGAAALYRKYPDEIGFTSRILATLAGQLALRGVRPAWLRVARLRGGSSEEELEFARYHRTWTWSYWGGFGVLRYWRAGS